MQQGEPGAQLRFPGGEGPLVLTVAASGGPWQQCIARMNLSTGTVVVGSPLFCVDSQSIVMSYRGLLERDGLVWFNTTLAVATIGPEGRPTSYA